MKISQVIFCIWIFAACTPKNENEIFSADNNKIRYNGRVDLSDPNEPVLIGSASFVEVAFSGESCQIYLRNLHPVDHNYYSLELDGKDLGRFKLENHKMRPFNIVSNQGSEKHVLKVFKSTEAQVGNIAFGGIQCKKLETLPERPKRKIEFIGNSITCGMGVDWKEIPCDAGAWYDQHNAYWAYGPQVSRALNTGFLISAVSGIGMYRNWNSLSPVMPEVYENMYLDTENKLWDFSRFAPDLVSISLGTNDFSDGDGVKERLNFDSALFVLNYIEFVKNVINRYPQAQICLLTSPMVSGEKGRQLHSCLLAVQKHFDQEESNSKKIAVFNFESITPNGCGYHPDRDDQTKMANLLIPYYKEIMGW